MTPDASAGGVAREAAPARTYSLTREEFRERAKTANMIPLYADLLADMETPVSAFLKVARGEYAFLLESVEGGERLARYSFLGSEPFMVLRTKGRWVEIEEEGEVERRELGPGGDPLHVLEQLMGRYTWSPDPRLPPFVGGAVGTLAYDLVRFFERLPDETKDDLHLPDVLLMFTHGLVIFDHVKHYVRVVVNERVRESGPDEAYDRAVERIEELIQRLKGPLPERRPATGDRQSGAALEVASNFEKPDFLRMVENVKEYIAAGDIIQCVPSQRFTASITADPFDVYRSLRSINPSPYMYYLKAGETYVVGSSPEILATEKDGEVVVRPIAGTIRRGETAEEDAKLAAQLLADEKERAEHIMLVDLGRNDIGRVCEYGSVHVDELMVIEKYSHVQHIVSNVVGKLSPGKTAYDVLRATFPAGTLSGAPKIRAMEIIEEQEPTKRGFYGGAIGYFSYSGSMDTAITIRTVVIQGDQAYIQAGGGVVADSVPENEYQESVNKARAVVRALEMAEKGLD
ncbi:MAG: anthranilate synthase component I [Armatimonadetes bacterium]|nr:anthranilate synthase component I [Armatimonadota bacterium]